MYFGIENRIDLITGELTCEIISLFVAQRLHSQKSHDVITERCLNDTHIADLSGLIVCPILEFLNELTFDDLVLGALGNDLFFSELGALCHNIVSCHT